MPSMNTMTRKGRTAEEDDDADEDESDCEVVEEVVAAPFVAWPWVVISAAASRGGAVVVVVVAETGACMVTGISAGNNNCNI